MEGSGETPGRDRRLRDWVQQLMGGTIVEWQRLVSGNSRATWSVDVDVDGDRLPLVVRVDPGDGPFSHTPLTLEREASIYAEMQGRGVALPRTYGFDGALSAVVLERAPGEPAWDEHVFGAALEELARLHAVDVDALNGDWKANSATADLEVWAGIAGQRIQRPSPFVDYAVPFLREHFPGEPGRLVVVHGDTGPGNILWDGRRITALLDWELTHIGDPHDDLAFMSVRAAMHGIELADFSTEAGVRYFAHTGLAPDEGRLRYWQAVGVLRNVITCQASISNPVRGRDRLVHYLLAPSLNRLLVDALARIEGIELPPPTLMKPAGVSSGHGSDPRGRRRDDGGDRGTDRGRGPPARAADAIPAGSIGRDVFARADPRERAGARRSGVRRGRRRQSRAAGAWRRPMAFALPASGRDGHRSAPRAGLIPGPAVSPDGLLPSDHLIDIVQPLEG